MLLFHFLALTSLLSLLEGLAEQAGNAVSRHTGKQGWARHSQLLPEMLGRSPWVQPDPLLPGEPLPALAPGPRPAAHCSAPAAQLH